jgi:hypothetical protein
MRRPFDTRASAFALLGSLALSFGCGAQTLEATDAQREACTPDAFRLCSAEIPDAGRVAACMGAHVDSLSPACRAVFQSHDSHTQLTHRHHHHYGRGVSSKQSLAHD